MSPEFLHPDHKGKGLKARAYNMYLTREVAHSFIESPSSVKETVLWLALQLDSHFTSTTKHPTLDDAFESIILAACMTPTQIFIGEMLDKSYSKTKPALGKERCYVVKSRQEDEEDLVVEYDDPKQDEFMRMALPLVVSVGERIGKQSKYHKYRPIWDLEAALRKDLSKKKDETQLSRRPSQNPEDLDDFSSFNPKRLQETNAQFLRNVMHYLTLLTAAVLKDNPYATKEDLIDESMVSIHSLEIASQYPQDIQRAAMGVPGKRYDELRKKYDLQPEMYSNGERYVIRRLEDPSHNPSMCVGSIIERELSGDSPIRHLTEFCIAQIAPWTLWKDIPTRDKKVQVIYDSN